MTYKGKTNEQLIKEIEILNKKVLELEKAKSKYQATLLANLEAKKELLIQSGRNQLILDTTLDSYILADTDGKIIEISEAGCDDYISKPINKDVLMAKIEKHLGN